MRLGPGAQRRGAGRGARTGRDAQRHPHRTGVRDALAQAAAVADCPSRRPSWNCCKRMANRSNSRRWAAWPSAAARRFGPCSKRTWPSAASKESNACRSSTEETPPADAGGSLTAESDADAGSGPCLDGAGTRRCTTAAFTPCCCTASPAAARPSCTCGPSRKSSRMAGRRWCWCRRSA